MATAPLEKNSIAQLVNTVGIQRSTFCDYFHDKTRCCNGHSPLISTEFLPAGPSPSRGRMPLRGFLQFLHSGGAHDFLRQWEEPLFMPADPFPARNGWHTKKFPSMKQIPEGILPSDGRIPSGMCQTGCPVTPGKSAPADRRAAGPGRRNMRRPRCGSRASRCGCS